MVALPPLVPTVSPTAQAIYDHYKKVGDAEQARRYLGGSIIGKACERALYFDFRWTTAKSFDGRLYRLFQSGHREEDRVINDLIAIGYKVWSRNPATGQQWSWADRDVGNHFAGNADGIVQGVLDAPVAPHLLEVKTHNTKSFTALKDKGVKVSKPQHYAQMQIYMRWSIADFGKANGCKRALYVAVCKDTDEIHAERVEYDEQFAEHLVSKANRVVFAQSLPAGISTDPTWYECKFCDHYGLCHGDAVPVASCRTCAHATPEREPHADGTPRWTCAAGSCSIPLEVQRTGCEMHRFVPFLLANWAEAIDSNDSGVQYRLKATGATFWNGEPPAGMTSQEIFSAQDKNALSSSEVQELRKVFGARIAA